MDSMGLPIKEGATGREIKEWYTTSASILIFTSSPTNPNYLHACKHHVHFVRSDFYFLLVLAFLLWLCYLFFECSIIIII